MMCLQHQSCSDRAAVLVELVPSPEFSSVSSPSQVEMAPVPEACTNNEFSDERMQMVMGGSKQSCEDKFQNEIWSHSK